MSEQNKSQSKNEEPQAQGVEYSRAPERGPEWNARVKPSTDDATLKKWKNLLVVGGLSCLIFLQYQNCTPSETGEMKPTSSISQEGTQVGVIDDVKANAALSFNEKLVELHTETQVINLEGNCPVAQEGAVLGWKVVDGSSGQELARGYAQCQSGQFHVELAPTQDLQCDQPYRVTARLGFGQAGEVILSRRCAPDAVADLPSQDAQVDAQLPQQMKAQIESSNGSACYLERREGVRTGCSAVCYSREGVVQSKSDLDPSACEL